MDRRFILNLFGPGIFVFAAGEMIVGREYRHLAWLALPGSIMWWAWRYSIAPPGILEGVLELIAYFVTVLLFFLVWFGHAVFFSIRASRSAHRMDHRWSGAIAILLMGVAGVLPFVVANPYFLVSFPEPARSVMWGRVIGPICYAIFVAGTAWWLLSEGVGRRAAGSRVSLVLRAIAAPSIGILGLPDLVRRRWAAAAGRMALGFILVAICIYTWRDLYVLKQAPAYLDSSATLWHLLVAWLATFGAPAAYLGLFLDQLSPQDSAWGAGTGPSGGGQ